MSKTRIVLMAFATLFLTGAAANGESMGLVVDEGTAKFYRERGVVIIDGTQSGDYRKERYAVLGKLSVDKDSKMEIAPGAVVYLAADAHIAVDGELAAKEVEFRPLPAELHYTVDRGAAAPKAAPWRGILVGPNGTVNLAGSTIQGALYGVHTLFPAASMKAALNSACFLDNTHYNIYSADRYVSPSNICVDSDSGAVPYTALCAPAQPPAINEKPKIRRIIPYGAATLAFAGLFAYDAVRHNSCYDKYNKAVDVDKATEYRKGAEDAATQAVIHGVLGLVGLGATAWVGYTVFF